MQRIRDIPADSAFSLAAVSGKMRPRLIITLPMQVDRETIAVISYVETAEEAWAMISARLSENPASDR